MNPARYTVVGIGALLFCLALAHTFEDFRYDVPHERFGIDTSPAAALLALAFLVQGAILFAAVRDRVLAYALNGAVGLAWLLAAALDHLGEVLTEEDYRAGIFSKTLEVGIMLSGSALVIASLAALWIRTRRSG